MIVYNSTGKAHANSCNFKQTHFSLAPEPYITLLSLLCHGAPELALHSILFGRQEMAAFLLSLIFLKFLDIFLKL